MIGHFSNLGGPEHPELHYIPVVGDSFTGDTPLFIKYDDGRIDIKCIADMISENDVEVDALGREYDYTKKPYKVLARIGWCEPAYIYRHKTDKPIYEVSDGENVLVEVTEDHSLFNDKKEKIKPSEITEETKFEFYDGNDIYHDFNNFIINRYWCPYYDDDPYRVEISIELMNACLDDK